MKTFTAIVYREDELYVAVCPEAGTASQGDTIEEALANLKEANSIFKSFLCQMLVAHL